MAQLRADDTEDAQLLFVSFDLPYTGPLADVRRVRDAWGVALALSAAPLPSSVARVELDWREATSGGSPETRCANAAFESARLGNPTARLLPLLQALAAAQRAQVVLAAGSGVVTVDVEAGVEADRATR
jgi:hypothetical protein